MSFCTWCGSVDCHCDDDYDAWDDDRECKTVEVYKGQPHRPRGCMANWRYEAEQSTGCNCSEIVDEDLYYVTFRCWYEEPIKLTPTAEDLKNIIEHWDERDHSGVEPGAEGRRECLERQRQYDDWDARR